MRERIEEKPSGIEGHRSLCRSSISLVPAQKAAQPVPLALHGTEMLKHSSAGCARREMVEFLFRWSCGLGALQQAKAPLVGKCRREAQILAYWREDRRHWKFLVWRATQQSWKQGDFLHIERVCWELRRISHLPHHLAAGRASWRLSSSSLQIRHLHRGARQRASPTPFL